jgi:PAS domain S-box-containing protein
VWVQLTATLVRDDAGLPAQAIAQIQDISERKQAEAALRASEARYERIAANLPGMVYQFVYRRDGSKGFTVVSEGVNRLFGVAPEAALRDHRALFDLIHPDDRADFHARGAVAVAARAPWRWEGRVVLPTGEEKWVQVASRQEQLPDGSTLSDGLLMDVTERRRIAQQLAESEQRLRSLVDHNIDAVMSFDLEGRFVSANPACQSLADYRPEELLGRPFAPFIAPEHLELTLERFRRAVEGASQTYEIAVLHKSGRRLDVIVNNVPIVVDGRVIGVFCVLKDVTEQRSLEAQLRQAQKMEAVGQLAGGIAHDFNNLVTAILLNTELVLGEMSEGPLRQDVETIRESAERGATLTRQLLAFSRKQIMDPRLVDLNVVVQETKRLLRRALGDGITLESELGDIGSVLADPGQLEQVLVNLAVNARDAMPKGGTLIVRTRDVVVDEPVARRHKGLRTGEYVTLAVEDTGIGMDAATQARIFEPFFTTKGVGRGTGLGLAMVYGIVKQSGGYVAVESTPGAGATFTIYLPRQQGVPSPETRAVARLPTGSETVLVVEDEATVRTSIRRILTRQGYTVLEARHGADALRVLDAATSRVDLVLTDLMMPEMGGRQLISELWARSTERRVLVVSGYDEHASLRSEPLPVGTHFLEKPFTVDGLLRSVRAALDTGPERAVGNSL